MQLLKDVLTDPDTPEQMLVSGVWLVKEAVLDAFSPHAASNVFASSLLLDALGGVLFSVNLPETTDVEDSLEEFLQSAEPLRLVEVLGLLFVLMQRDTENKVGEDDRDLV